MAFDFSWAQNKTKLEQSVSALQNAKKVDAKVEINEETVKAEYIKRAGLVIGEVAPAVVTVPVAPEVNSTRTRGRTSASK